MRHAVRCVDGMPEELEDLYCCSQPDWRQSAAKVTAVLFCPYARPTASVIPLSLPMLLVYI